MTDRIKLLEQFIADDPTDPFNYYALGLEYIKMDVHKALNVLSNLKNDHKEYLATYYQLAKLYEYVGQTALAIATYEEGIALALKQRDVKTLQELRSGLEGLNDDE